MSEKLKLSSDNFTAGATRVTNRGSSEPSMPEIASFELMTKKGNRNFLPRTKSEDAKWFNYSGGGYKNPGVSIYTKTKEMPILNFDYKTPYYDNKNKYTPASTNENVSFTPRLGAQVQKSVSDEIPSFQLSEHTEETKFS